MPLHPITITPTKDANGNIEWTLTYGNKSGSKAGEYPAVSIPNGGVNERFKITLVDSAYGITFSGDPLWVQAGSCPTCSGIDSLIDDVKTTASVVRFRDLNTNQAPVSLWYRLNFDVPGLNPGDPGTYLDPEIRNGGNGGPGVSQYLVIAGIAGAALATYAAYEAFFDH